MSGAALCPRQHLFPSSRTSPQSPLVQSPWAPLGAEDTFARLFAEMSTSFVLNFLLQEAKRDGVVGKEKRGFLPLLGSLPFPPACSALLAPCPPDTLSALFRYLGMGEALRHAGDLRGGEWFVTL